MHRILLLYLLILFYFPATGNSGKDSSCIRIYKVIDNDERPSDTFRSMEDNINRMLNNYNITGASFALSKDGRLVYAHGFGYADKEKGVNVLPQHQFRIASVSKLITAIAIFKLIESNQLSLDQQVFGKGGILDEAIYNFHINDSRIKEITVRHLLTHSAGWDYSERMDPMFNPRLVTRGNDYIVDPNLTNLISHALQQGLTQNPGTESHYFNLGYCMLGEIIEKVSGSPYESFVHQNIISPLELHSFQLGKNMKEDRNVNEVLYYDFALRNSFNGTGKLVPRPYGGTPIELLGPSGGWIANTMDLVKLTNAIDGFASLPDILSQESIDTMTQLTGVFPMGWISITQNNDWLRSGTLAGTHALVVRKNNGINYAMVVNTSTGLSHRFSEEMFKTIEESLPTIKHWPAFDIFSDLKNEYVLLQKKKLLPNISHQLFANLSTTVPANLLSKKE